MIVITSRYFLDVLHRARTDEIVVTTMAVVRPWGALSSSPLDFASADSAMGHAADLALGIALAQPRRKVICLNGDGSMLMTLGTLATITHSGAQNIIVFVMQNGVYEITGHQPIPGYDRLDFPSMARAAGFAHVFHCDTEDQCTTLIPEILNGPGPAFVSITVEPGVQGPISRSAHEESAYLRQSLADSARVLRAAIVQG